MKKKVFIIVVLILVGLAGFNFCSGQTSKDKLKEGDMIFHISQSQQSPLIQYATKSTLSHCGIIIEKKDGLYVLWKGLRSPAPVRPQVLQQSPVPPRAQVPLLSQVLQQSQVQ